MNHPDILEAPTSIFLIRFVQVFIFICLFTALIYGVNELILFTIILHVISLIAYFWSRYSLKNVKTEISVNHYKIFPEDPLKIDIDIENNKLLPILFKVDICAPHAICNSDDDQWIHEELCLLSHQHSNFSRTYYPSKRGVYCFGAPFLRTGDPFGFFLRHKAISDQKEVVVYPRVIPIKPFAVIKKEFFKNASTWSPVDDPILIFGTRDYQPNRSSRNINWKVSARFNCLQEKLCEPAVQEKMLIILDVGSYTIHNKAAQFEQSLEFIASLLIALHRKNIPVGFVTNGKLTGNGIHNLPISSSSLHISKILETLARLEMKKLDTIANLFSKGVHLPWGTSSIYISNHPTPDLTSIQLKLKRHNVPLKIILSEPTTTDNGFTPIGLQNITAIADLINPGDPK